jgi:flagellar motor component MotA
MCVDGACGGYDSWWLIDLCVFLVVHQAIIATAFAKFDYRRVKEASFRILQVAFDHTNAYRESIG